MALDPDAAGMFSYIRKAFGPAAAFISSVLYWASGILGGIAVAIACSGYLGVYVPSVAHEPGSSVCTISFLWLLIGVNWIGPRFIARLSGWTLALGLVPVLLAAFCGWPFFHAAIFVHSWNPTGVSLSLLIPRGAVMAFWAFTGIEGAIILAPRIRNPGRNVAIATLGGLGIAAAIYIAACAALMGIIPAAVLAKSSAPFSDAARVIAGAAFAGAVAFCALIKASGTLGVGSLVTMESLESEAVIAVLHGSRRPTRRVSGGNMLFTGAVSTAIALGSASPTLVRQFTIMADVSVVLSMLIYGAVCLALLPAAKPLPLGRWSGAWTVGGGGALFCGFIVLASEPDLLIWSVLPVLLALLIYWGLASRRAHLELSRP